MKGQKRLIALVGLAVIVIAAGIIGLTRPKGQHTERITITPGMGAEKGVIAGIDLKGLNDSLKNIETILAEVAVKEKESRVPPAVRRDPMRPAETLVVTSILRGGGTVRPEAEIAPLPPFTVTGILYDETAPIAIIDGEVRLVNETVGGWRVTAITPDTVTVERDGRSFLLSVRAQTVEEIRKPSPAARLSASAGEDAKVAYAVQIASCTAGGLAQMKRQADRIRAGIPEVRIVRVGSRYALRAGRFGDRKEAASLLSSVRKNFPTALIVTVTGQEAVVYPDVARSAEEPPRPDSPPAGQAAVPATGEEFAVASYADRSASDRQENDGDAVSSGDCQAADARPEVAVAGGSQGAEPLAAQTCELTEMDEDRTADWEFFCRPVEYESLNPPVFLASGAFPESAIAADARQG